MILSDITAGGPEDVILSETAETALVAIAQNLGFFVLAEEANALIAIMETEQAKAGAGVLNEVKSIVRLNRQAKLDGLIMHSALVIAQQKKDPIFKKWAQAAAIKRKFQSLLVRKYNSQAQMTARKLLANAGKHNMVDISNSKHFNHDDMHSEVPTAGKPTGKPNPHSGDHTGVPSLSGGRK